MTPPFYREETHPELDTPDRRRMLEELRVGLDRCYGPQCDFVLIARPDGKRWMQLFSNEDLARADGRSDASCLALQAGEILSPDHALKHAVEMIEAEATRQKVRGVPGGGGEPN